MNLLDQYGNEIKHNKPVLNEIAIQAVHSRFSSYPSNGLTPERLAKILREADQGNMLRQAELFEEMEEKNCHLGCVLGTRKLAPCGLDWEILPASSSVEDKKNADEAKEFIEYIENWEDGILNIMDAVGKGWSVNEIMWEIVGKQVWCKSVKWWHQKDFTFITPEGLHVLDVPHLITDENPVYGEELLPNKFIFHRHLARSGATSRGGLLRPCTYMYLFVNYDVKDWVIFNSLYSVPMRVGKYNSASGKEEKDALKRALHALGVDAAAMISDSTIIELLEAKNRGDAQAFQSLADYCERAMSKVVLGHTGSAESTAGKLGGEQEAKDVRQDLIEYDAKALAKTIKFQLLKPWITYNKGPDVGVPKFKFRYEPQEDQEKIAKVYGTLVKDVGFGGIPVAHIHERFGIPIAKAGEATVQPSQSFPLPGSGPTLPSDKAGSIGSGADMTVANKIALPTSSTVQFTPVQQSIEKLKITTFAQSDDAMIGMLKQTVDIIMGASSYEEALAHLAVAYDAMDETDLAELLAQACFSAQIAGRIDSTP